MYRVARKIRYMLYVDITQPFFSETINNDHCIEARRRVEHYLDYSYISTSSAVDNRHASSISAFRMCVHGVINENKILYFILRHPVKKYSNRHSEKLWD